MFFSRWNHCCAVILGQLLLYHVHAAGEDAVLLVIEGKSENAVANFVRKNTEPKHAVAVLTVREGSGRHSLMKEVVKDPVIRNAVAFGVHFKNKGFSSLEVHCHRYPIEVYDGKWTATAIRTWLRRVGYPLVNVMSDSFPPAKYLGEAPFGTVLIVKDLGSQTDELVKALEPWAGKFREKLKYTFFTKAPATQELCNQHGVWSNDELIVLQDPSQPWQSGRHSATPAAPKYRLEGVTVESVRQFFERYDAGAWPRYYMSILPNMPPVEKEGILEITSWNWEEIIEDNSKSVLLNLVSEDCRSCEEFEPGYVDVARKVANKRKLQTHGGWANLVLARMDQKKNEHSENVVGTPALLFWKSGKRRKSRQLDLRSPEGLFDFLESQVEEEGGRGEQEL